MDTVQRLSTPVIVALITCCLQSSSLTRAAEPIARLPGVVKPAEYAELAATAGGSVHEILVTEGEPVHFGQVLLRLDDSVARAALAVSEISAKREAAIQLAEARLELAEQYRQRIAEAYRQKAATPFEQEQARLRVQEAQAALAEARENRILAAAEAELQRARLQQLQLRSPLDGIVIRVNRALGETLTAGETALVVANLERLKVELHVPVAEASMLKLTQPYWLSASEPVNRLLPATLRYREPILNAATETLRCIFEIENLDGKLPAGFTVVLELQQEPARPPSEGVASQDTRLMRLQP